MASAPIALGSRCGHNRGMAAPSSPSPAAAVLTELEAVRGWAADFYRGLHAHPELSHEEHATASQVAARLGNSGIEVHTRVGETGVVGLIRNGEGPVVLLRADMDALPVAEATGLDYASHISAADAAGNEVPVIHACGHDMHVACLLGAAHLLAASPGSWAGTVVTVFQPAEETGDGARGMLDDGLAALLPKVDVTLAQHVLPAPAGLVGTHAGPTLSAADSMRITVHGRGAHRSMPQALVDPVVLAAMIVVRLQTVVAVRPAPGSTSRRALARRQRAGAWSATTGCAPGSLRGNRCSWHRGEPSWCAPPLRGAPRPSARRAPLPP